MLPHALAAWLVLAIAVGSHAADNGEALLPPMGWRSWNCYYADISDAKIRAQIDALTKPRDANGTSLRSLGYASIGIDEGWEGKEVHYANGTPAVDATRFPDLPGLVEYGHAKGVKMGFYLNGCGYHETVEKRINYEGDVRATTSWGFDAVKIDSCGAQTNMTLYYELFNRSGRALAIENCHQGRNITDGGDPDQMGPGWCPYNWFRTSGDIVNLWDRVMGNLMTVVPFLETPAAAAAPASRPGCWAYPDMLEVGRMPEHNAAESRSHFAAWAIVSAPLVLGFDLSDEGKLAAAWPVISNREVLAISQAWVAGADYPTGRLLKSWQAPNVPTFVVRGSCASDGRGCVDQAAQCPQWAAAAQCELNPAYMLQHCKRSCGRCGAGDSFTAWRFEPRSAGAPQLGSLRSGELCLDLRGQLPAGHEASNHLHALPCDATQPTQLWSFNGSAGAIRSAAPPVEQQAPPQEGGAPCLHVLYHWLWDYQPLVDTEPCGGAPSRAEQWTLHANGTLSNAQFGCIALSSDSGPPSTIWAKPLPGGRVALLAINGADAEQQIGLDFQSLLGVGGKWAARDVWAGADLGTLNGLTRAVPPHDCVLLVLSPAQEGLLQLPRTPVETEVAADF